MRYRSIVSKLVFCFFVLLFNSTLIYSQLTKSVISFKGFEIFTNYGISADGNVVYCNIVDNEDSKNDSLLIVNTRLKKRFVFSGFSTLGFLNGTHFLKVSIATKNKNIALVNTNDGTVLHFNTKKIFETANKNVLVYEESDTKQLKLYQVAEQNDETISENAVFVIDNFGGCIIYTKDTRQNRQLLCRKFQNKLVDTVWKYTSEDSIGKIIYQSNGNSVGFSLFRNSGKEVKYFIISTNNNGQKKVDSLDVQDIATFPKDIDINTNFHFSIAGEGRTILFGIGGKPKVQPLKENGVIVWNAKIKELSDQISATKAIGGWSFSNNSFFAITSDSLPQIEFIPGGCYAVSFNPFQYGPSFSADSADFVLTNLQTGCRKTILEKTSHPFRYYGHGVFPSPSGKYIAYYKDLNWWAYDIRLDSHINLSQNLPFPPVADSIGRQRRIVGKPVTFPGWTQDDKEVVLYDAYDIFMVDPVTSVVKKLTDGRKDCVVFRLNMDEGTSRGNQIISFEKPLLLRMTKEMGWKTGYSLLYPGKSPHLLFFDEYENYLLQSGDVRKVMRLRYRADCYPELLFLSGESLIKSQLIRKTNTNFVKHFSKFDLLNYKSEGGQQLQGVLFYPANYSSNKKYPMIVNIYETQSKIVHEYPSPLYFNDPNQHLTYTEAGYFVFMPDIKIKINSPGGSALNCVEAGIKKALENVSIDARRIGLTGHSFGGFETAFILSHSYLFAAGIVQAGVYDLTSFALTETVGREPGYRNFEYQQFRIDGTLADKLNVYLENSPTHNAHNIQVPILNMVGKKDIIVPWTQSLELFNAMRRFGKTTSLVMYPTGNHLVASSFEDRIDFWQKKLDWWNHYLKGMPAADWMKND